MNVYYGIQEFRKLDNAVVTSGTFDGVHLGHQKILNRLNEVAKLSDGESVVITFYPHPRSVIYLIIRQLSSFLPLKRRLNY